MTIAPALLLMLYPVVSSPAAVAEIESRVEHNRIRQIEIQASTSTSTPGIRVSPDTLLAMGVIADVAITEYGIAAGIAEEANPLPWARHTSTRIATSIALGGSNLYIAKKLRGKKTGQAIFYTLTLALKLYATERNAQIVLGTW